MLCLVTQSCPASCDRIDCSPPGSSVHGDSPGQNTPVGCHALLQGIFSAQGLNLGLPHCRQILYHLSHQGSLKNSYNSIKNNVKIRSKDLHRHTTNECILMANKPNDKTSQHHKSLGVCESVACQHCAFK